MGRAVTFHAGGQQNTEATKAMRIRWADDVLQLPLPPGVSGYELVDGEPVEVTPAGQRHGRLAVEIGARLLAHIRERPVRGMVYVEAGYVLGLRHDPERLRAPDVSFITHENLARCGGEPERGFLRGAPDLAVEVESPERPEALQQRIQDYLEAGTRLVWVIHSLARSATIYHADGSARLLLEHEVLDGEDVVRGLRVPLSELFHS
jgi:Uma2 family endonuclease